MRRIEQRCSPLSPARSDRGFTFIEVLVSLTVLSLIAVVVWAALSNARTLIDKISYRGSTTAKTVQLDTFLRSSCRKVRPPFWLTALEVTSADGRLSIPYYDGEPDRHLVLEVEGSYLTVRSEPGEESLRFGPFEEIALGTISQEGQLPWGVEVRLQTERATPLTLTCRLGAVPLASGSPP